MRLAVHAENLVTEEPLHGHEIDLGLAQVLLDALHIIDIGPDLELCVPVPGASSLYGECARTLPKDGVIYDLLARHSSRIDVQKALGGQDEVV
jgi:hypothetical protein